MGTRPGSCLLVVAVALMPSTMLYTWLYASAAPAAVYKWVDENGKVHYTDRPPIQGAEQLEIEPSAQGELTPGETERRERQRKLLDAFAKERAEREAMERERKQELMVKKERCERAREELRKANEASFLYDYDEQGNRAILSDDEHRRAIEYYESKVKEYC